jgi:hypothetical protein
VRIDVERDRKRQFGEAFLFSRVVPAQADDDRKRRLPPAVVRRAAVLDYDVIVGKDFATLT